MRTHSDRFDHYSRTPACTRSGRSSSCNVPQSLYQVLRFHTTSYNRSRDLGCDTRVPFERHTRFDNIGRRLYRCWSLGMGTPRRHNYPRYFAVIHMVQSVSSAKTRHNVYEKSCQEGYLTYQISGICNAKHVASKLAVILVGGAVGCANWKVVVTAGPKLANIWLLPWRFTHTANVRIFKLQTGVTFSLTHKEALIVVRHSITATDGHVIVAASSESTSVA